MDPLSALAAGSSFLVMLGVGLEPPARAARPFDQIVPELVRSFAISAPTAALVIGLESLGLVNATMSLALLMFLATGSGTSAVMFVRASGAGSSAVGATLLVSNLAGALIIPLVGGIWSASALLEGAGWSAALLVLPLLLGCIARKPLAPIRLAVQATASISTLVLIAWVSIDRFGALRGLDRGDVVAAAGVLSVLALLGLREERSGRGYPGYTYLVVIRNLTGIIALGSLLPDREQLLGKLAVLGLGSYTAALAIGARRLARQHRCCAANGGF